MTGNFKTIPIIDLSLSTSAITKPRFLSQLQDAIVNVGFFYLKTHRVPEHVQQGLLDQTIKFFDLTADKKQEVDIINSKHFLGYIGQEATLSKSTADRREIYTVRKQIISASILLYLTMRSFLDRYGSGCTRPRRATISQFAWSKSSVFSCPFNLPNNQLFLTCPHDQWPEESDLPQFRQMMQGYRQEICQLADDFKILIAEALDLEPTAFMNLFDDPPDNRLVLAKYSPPPPSSDNDALFQGIGTHKDSSFLTFLLLGTPHPGLEVQNKSGTWISVPPVPNTLVVNIGRQLEALTQGICKATTHRVSFSRQNFLDKNGNPLGPRYTFPLFQSLRLDLTLEDTLLKIPPHIADMIKGKEVTSDATNVSQEVFKEGVGAGAFHVRALRNRWVTEKWYPGLLDEIKRTRKRIRNTSRPGVSSIY